MRREHRDKGEWMKRIGELVNVSDKLARTEGFAVHLGVAGKDEFVDANHADDKSEAMAKKPDENAKPGYMYIGKTGKERRELGQCPPQ